MTAAKHDVVYIFANFITMNEEHKSDWSYRYFGMVTTHQTRPFVSVQSELLQQYTRLQAWKETGGMNLCRVTLPNLVHKWVGTICV